MKTMWKHMKTLRSGLSVFNYSTILTPRICFSPCMAMLGSPDSTNNILHPGCCNAMLVAYFLKKNHPGWCIVLHCFCTCAYFLRMHCSFKTGMCSGCGRVHSILVLTQWLLSLKPENIAREQNCPNIPILNSETLFCLFVFFVFFSFCRFVRLSCCPFFLLSICPFVFDGYPYKVNLYSCRGN